MMKNRKKTSGPWIWLAAAALVIFGAFLPAKIAKADQVSGYLMPDSAWRCYSASEIADMPLQVVCYAKNEIYARNGRMFVSSELQNYFYTQDWYWALYRPEQFTPDMLNTYETANIGLLDDRERQLGTYSLDVPGYSYTPVYEYMMYHGWGPSSYSYPYSVDPDSYIFADSDSRYLSDAEISQLTLQELCYAKNEIYARRGRRFVSNELQTYFDLKNWYWGSIAPDQFSDGIFNQYESANVAALSRMETARGTYQLDQPGYSYEAVRSFSYTTYSYTPSTSEYIFWDSNLRYLSDAEVANLSLQMLCYARNEIYARRGYIFNSQELRDYFGSKLWYHGTIPSSSFSSSVFNNYEMTNVELLKRYEYSINPNGYQLY